MKAIIILVLLSNILFAAPKTYNEWEYHWEKLDQNQSHLSISHFLILHELNQFRNDPNFTKELFKPQKNQLLDSLLDPIRQYYHPKKNVGWIDQYALIGPFKQKESFQTQLLPETSPYQKDLIFQGKNQDVHWKEISGHHYHGYIDFKNFLNGGKDVIGYLITDLHVTKSDTYQIRLGTGSKATLLLNQHQIFAKKYYSKSGYDQYIFQGYLPKGIHRLMVKVSARYEWGLYLRILDQRGKISQNISAHVPSETPVKNIKQDFKQIPFPHPTSKDELTLMRRGLFENHFFTGDREQHPYPGEIFLQQAREKAKNSVDQGFIAYYQGMYGATKNLWEQRMHFARDRGILPAIYDLIEQNLRDGYLHLVYQSLKRYQDQLDGDYRYHLLKLRYLQKQHIASSYFEKGAHYKFNAYYHFTLDQIRFQDHLDKIIDLHLKVKNQRFFKESQWNYLFTLLLEENRFDQYQKLLQERLSLYPYHYTYNLYWMKLLLAQKQYQSVVQYYQKHQSILKDAPEILKLVGKTYQYLNQNQIARKFYQNYLKLKPSDSSITKFLSHQVNQTRELWAKPYLKKILKRTEKLEKKSDTNPPVSTLYDHSIIKIHPDYSYNLFHTYAVKIERRELLPHYKTVPIYYQSDSQKIVHSKVNLIKKNGDHIEIPQFNNRYIQSKKNGAFMNYARRRYTIDNLEVGDIIEVSYYLDDRNRYQNPFFGKTFKLRQRTPVDLKTIMVLPDQKMTLKNNLTSELITTEKLFIFPQQQEILPEAGSTGYTSNYPFLTLTTQKNWDEVIDWYKTLLKGTNQVPKIVQNEIIKGTKKLNTCEKIQWIQEYVLKNTHYIGIELGINSYKPFSVNQVLERKFGDCKDKANLLNALLGVVGIQANMVLVRTTSQGALPKEIPPSPRYFNHAISYIPSLDRFIDGTAELNGIEALPENDQGAMALIIKSGEQLRHIPPRSSQEDVIIEGERLGDDLLATVKISLSGSRGARYRYLFQNRKKQIDIIESSMAYLGEIEIKDLKITHLDQIQKPLIYQYKIKISDLFKNNHFQSTLLLRGLSKKMKLMLNRKTEFRLPFYTFNETIILKNIKLKKYPKKVAIKGIYIDFSQEMKNANNTLRISNQFRVKKPLIPPAHYLKWGKQLLTIENSLKTPCSLE